VRLVRAEDTRERPWAARGSMCTKKRREKVFADAGESASRDDDKVVSSAAPFLERRVNFKWMT